MNHSPLSHSHGRRGSVLIGYALSLAATGLSAATQMIFVGPVQTRAPFLLFYPAIAITAFMAGIGPGLAAAVFAGLYVVGLFHFRPGPISWTALVTFGPVVAIAFARMREIRDHDRATSRELARFKFIGDNASDWILLLSEAGVIQYANQTACKTLGWTPEELLGRHFETLVVESQRTALRDLLRGAMSGDVHPVEMKFQPREGPVVISELNCTGIRTDEDCVIHAVARDITERRQIEQKLSQLRLWDSLRVMAGGLAHDFNNLLVSVVGNAALAKDMLPPHHEVLELLDSVVNAGEQSADLVRLMLATSGHRSRESERLEMKTVVNWILSRGTLPEKIHVTTHVDASVFTGDRRSLETLLWSLVMNAAESYGNQPGEVAITVCMGSPPDSVPVSFEEGDTGNRPCLGIIVEDSGCGMPATVLERAFDPFYSTKFTGRGLGLPAVRGIVRAYEGKLRLHTGEGTGTRVEVWLPAQ